MTPHLTQGFALESTAAPGELRIFAKAGASATVVDFQRLAALAAWLVQDVAGDRRVLRIESDLPGTAPQTFIYLIDRSGDGGVPIPAEV